MDEKKEEERTLTTTIMKTSHFVCLCLSGQDWPRQIFDKTRFILLHLEILQILSNLEAWLLKYFPNFIQSSITAYVTFWNQTVCEESD